MNGKVLILLILLVLLIAPAAATTYTSTNYSGADKMNAISIASNWNIYYNSTESGNFTPSHFQFNGFIQNLSPFESLPAYLKTGIDYYADAGKTNKIASVDYYAYPVSFIGVYWSSALITGEIIYWNSTGLNNLGMTDAPGYEIIYKTVKYDNISDGVKTGGITVAEGDYWYNITPVIEDIGLCFSSRGTGGYASKYTPRTSDRIFVVEATGATGGGTTIPNGSIYGYTIDGYTGSILATVLVKVTHGTTNTTDLSDANGYYNISGLEGDVSTTVEATKGGYTFTPFTFTPAPDYSYNVTILMMPNSISGLLNGAIGGFVYAKWDHSPIKGATVHISNATWSDTNTSIANGLYMFDGLATGSTYSVYAEATGYDNSDTESVTTSIAGTLVQQDLELPAQYDVTVTAKDGSTGATIQGIPIYFEASDGQIANTTFGYTIFTMDGGYHTFTATAEGYSVGQASATVTADTSVTLLMYNTSYIPSDVVAYGVHQVRFSVRNEWGAPLENIAVSAQGYETTAGDWSWLYSLLGINFDSTPIHNQSMAGTTARDGSIVFMMIESVKYDLNFLNATLGINENYTVYPKDDYYEFWLTTGENWFTSGYNALDEINITVKSIRKNTTHGFINITYSDALLGTTGGTIYVNQTNKTGVDLPDITVSSKAITTSIFNTSFTVPADDDSYFVVFGITHSTFGTVVRTFSVIFEKATVGIGLPSSWNIYLAVFFILFTGMFFGAVTSPTVGAVITAFVGWVMWGLGWLADMGTTAPIALTFATFIAVISTVMARSRKERYL